MVKQQTEVVRNPAGRHLIPTACIQIVFTCVQLSAQLLITKANYNVNKVTCKQDQCTLKNCIESYIVD